MLNGATVTAIVAAGLIIVDFVIRVLSLVIIPRNRRPQTALAWLLAIFFIPYAGLIAFLLFGSTKLPRRRRLKQQQINRYVMDATEGIRVAEERPEWPPWWPRGQPVFRATLRATAWRCKTARSRPA